MKVSFANRQLERLCESGRKLQRTHGAACTKKLLTRFADLEAAASLEQMRGLPGRCHELGADRDGELAIDLAGGKRLILEPDGDPPPEKEDGGLDWTKVDAVRLVEIVDYHE